MTAHELIGRLDVCRALERPATLADIVAAGDRTIAETTRILLEMIRTGQAMAYCTDHFISSEVFPVFWEDPAASGALPCRRVVDALAEPMTTAMLVARTGLPDGSVRGAVLSLVRLGTVNAERWQRRRGDGMALAELHRRRVGHMAAQAAALLMLDTPLSSGQIAKAIGYDPATMNDLVQDLKHRGEVSHLKHSAYVRAATPKPASARVIASQKWQNGRRPQPVRDAILACLAEPRQAMEIAQAIGRTVPNVTGHLGAMLRLGLVERIGYGRYAVASCPARQTRSR
ncbi:hypothetical protein WDZ11_22370 (plasmid) [Roseomonas mucosa]|uniref:hypothetical protein n=1 Tax=Roseomonas mucosa TaxID=207340 RepID=UPI0030D14B64